jgi:hypothetical protein
MGVPSSCHVARLGKPEVLSPHQLHRREESPELGVLHLVCASNGGRSDDQICFHGGGQRKTFLDGCFGDGYKPVGRLEQFISIPQGHGAGQSCFGRAASTGARSKERSPVVQSRICLGEYYPEAARTISLGEPQRRVARRGGRPRSVRRVWWRP